MRGYLRIVPLAPRGSNGLYVRRESADRLESPLIKRPWCPRNRVRYTSALSAAPTSQHPAASLAELRPIRQTGYREQLRCSRHAGGPGRRPCRSAAGQTTTSPGKIKLHRLDKWPVIRAEQTGYDLARRIVHASMGSGERSRNFAGRPSPSRYPHETRKRASLIPTLPSPRTRSRNRGSNL